MKYRLPRIEDYEQVIEYVQEHYSNNENILHGSLGLTSMKFEEWVNKINMNVNIPDEVWGKSLTYLAFDNNGKLIGLLNIRFDLSEDLVDKYGHVGYGVRPSERRKGYAAEMLAYALKECKKLGMKNVVLGCYKENIGSAKTIMKNGGKLIREVDDYNNINDYWKINLVTQYYEIEMGER